MKLKTSSNNDTFWISYADLMAGLLFIFILLVGAIIIKFLFLQQDIKIVSQELMRKENRLKISIQELEEKKKKLGLADSRLTQLEKEAIESALLIQKLRSQEEALKQRQNELSRLNYELNASLQASTAALNASNLTAQERQERIELSNTELEQLNKKLLMVQEENFELSRRLSVSDLRLQESTQALTLTNEELVKMSAALLQKNQEHQSIVEQLDLTKMQIKHLTGMRINVISALKKSVGKKIKIDPKNGSIRFESGVFFKHDAAELTPKAKEDLKMVLNEYIDTLLSNPEIEPFIDRIDIIGHSSSEGDYFYNLSLSQRRAYVVLEYLMSQDFRYAKKLQKILSATGRSSNEPILKDGVEDKEASRRIEIKFRLKDEEAIRQIESILG